MGKGFRALLLVVLLPVSSFSLEVEGFRYIRLDKGKVSLEVIGEVARAFKDRIVVERSRIRTGDMVVTVKKGIFFGGNGGFRFISAKVRGRNFQVEGDSINSRGRGIISIERPRVSVLSGGKKVLVKGNSSVLRGLNGEDELTFQGGAFMEVNGFRLNSEKLVLKFKNGKLLDIAAKGNVFVLTESKKAKCNSFSWVLGSGRMVLKGDVVVSEKGSVFKGGEVVYYPEKGVFKSSGGGGRIRFYLR